MLIWQRVLLYLFAVEVKESHNNLESIMQTKWLLHHAVSGLCSKEWIQNIVFISFTPRMAIKTVNEILGVVLPQNDSIAGRKSINVSDVARINRVSPGKTRTSSSTLEVHGERPTHDDQVEKSSFKQHPTFIVNGLSKVRECFFSPGLSVICKQTRMNCIWL